MASLLSWLSRPRIRPQLPNHEAAQFQSLLTSHRLGEAERLLDRVLDRRGLFKIVSIPIETDADDPVVVTFETTLVRIRLRAHDHPAKIWGQAHRITYLLPLLLACRDTGATGTAEFSLMDADNRDSISFSSNRPGSTLIPDPEFLQSWAYNEFREALRATPVAWDDRRPLVLWRGVTTGIGHPSDWRRLPRIELCRRFSAQTERYDVGLTKVVQIEDPDAERALHDEGLMRGFVPMTAASNYRYQLDIDGNSNAWAGLFMKLMTGSPVLKVASLGGYRQWYYDRLVPWKTFVPVASTLDNLDERVDWLRRNDDEARKIGRAGRRLALSLRYDAEVARARRRIMRRIT